MPEIIFCNPVTDLDYQLVVEIFKEYQKYLGIDLCFQHFDHELNNLKSIYQKPKGIIILAKKDNEIIGCVALKPIEKNNCEMKRLYVKPAYRGNGIGQKLTKMLIDFAQKNKYDIMKLDTLLQLNEAIDLYKRLGFKTTNPYVLNPLNDVLYFEKELKNE